MLDKFSKKLDQLIVEKDLLTKQLTKEKQKLKLYKQNILDIEEAQKIVQKVAQAIQNQVHKVISSVVTKALHDVFGETAYSFEIEFTKKRNKTEANLIFIRDGHKLHPLEDCGIGQVDVAAFTLRLVGIMLSSQVRRLLVLDEPFKNVSEEYITNIRDMLLSMVQDFSFQIILVTHNKQLHVGKVVNLEKV